MKPPDGLVVTFKAVAFREGTNRKSCTMFNENNELKCYITKLQPNSVYTVALEACKNEDDCVAYGDSVRIQTRPGAPGYSTLESSASDSLTMSIKPPTDATERDYVYAGTFETSLYTNVFGGGCEMKQLAANSVCQTDLAVPDTYYYFRTFACTLEHMLCTEGPQKSARTKAPGVKLPKPEWVGQTSTNISWTKELSTFHNIRYVFVYAKDYYGYTQQCFSTTRDKCRLKNLRPDTYYTITTSACKNLGFCIASTDSITIRTKKPDYLTTPTNVSVRSLTLTTVNLTWTELQVEDINVRDSIEYMVSLKAINDPKIPDKRVFFSAYPAPIDGNYLVENLYTDVNYSITVSVCASDDVCSYSSKPVTVRTVAKDGYIFKATSIEPLTASVSWHCSKSNPDSELRVLLNSSPTAVCTSADSVGEHTCQVTGLLPSSSNSVKLTRCEKATDACEDLYNLYVRTASGGM
ncbi:unnamed protein product [Dibothriocephalus latus]|uniref:Fibronectin type-III domain-containing protein n=1 Tax=Dibothriocephalus latus TaxID=60516 RepID=A0A3P7LCV7_DIBLA|nr:unnamed protein product [Dibothriocephalus latus]